MLRGNLWVASKAKTIACHRDRSWITKYLTLTKLHSPSNLSLTVGIKKNKILCDSLRCDGDF